MKQPGMCGMSKVVHYFSSVIKLMAANALHGGMIVMKNNVLIT